MNQEITPSSQIEKDLYRFVLYLNDQVIAEKVFPAYLYNHYTRFNLDIRPISPEIIKSFQHVLSNKDEQIAFDLYEYNLLGHYKEYNDHFLKSESKLVTNPNGKMENGRYVNEFEKFRFVLYINNKHIIERNFSVYNYNPKVRFSVDLVDTFDEAVEKVKGYIKKKDLNNMWEEFTIMNNYNMTVDKIRVLSKEEREKLLSKLSSN